MKVQSKQLSMATLSCIYGRHIQIITQTFTSFSSKYKGFSFEPSYSNTNLEQHAYSLKKNPNKTNNKSLTKILALQA